MAVCIGFGKESPVSVLLAEPSQNRSQDNGGSLTVGWPVLTDVMTLIGGCKMNALLREMPDFTTSWWRYTLAMMRATNREVSEFNDNLFIAAHIAMTAARDNPLSMMETFEILEHNVTMGRKGLAGMQAKTGRLPSTRSKKGRAPS
jgi:hypothetical protein